MRSSAIGSFWKGFAPVCLSASLILLDGPAHAQAVVKPAVDADGTIHVPAFDLPLSSALSPEARESVKGWFGGEFPNPDMSSEQAYRDSIDKLRAGRAVILKMSDSARQEFQAKTELTRIGGVPVEVFTPRAGVAAGNAKRVLINLHGGGFIAGRDNMATESEPIAALGGFKVVSIDYRHAYEHRFPAASEDVAAVYRELLKTYPARNIGIYGCSAGGALTLQSINWFIDKKLPLPGAAGVFGSGGGPGGGGGGSGDARYFSAIGWARPAPPASAGTTPRTAAPYGYFAGAPLSPLTDVLQSPPEVLAKFPPTLLITATRAPDMGPAIATHRALTRAGVDASLQVFDGLGHCFLYTHQLPESRDAFQTIVRFFDRNLGR